ncbi:vitamin-B12 independent methionine synthase [Gordonia sp. (in: high G+C Gram-positive bacteria)]|uniref:vitamin-B12 independent methionine synthase n=1 Tax=Gordonia sp. (in: high G+C Gram-positive bacteria) TaxID=84139 RepID=UPI00257EEC2D|nr:vitamin-B12 independent methionine synthase [Gordonia sp. (in: high G+C Gram-positive bacteria)]
MNAAERIQLGGTGTGIGSMPGTDAREAAAVVNGELDLAHLVELPARGVGADMIGRMAAVLVDLPMDADTWGYRLGSRGAGSARRARDHLQADLDAVEEIWDAAGFIGTSRPFKIQVCGPFTLSASVELPSGHKVLRDRGAWRDVVASTAEGTRELAGEVTRRLGAEIIVQLDEPMVGQVIDGAVVPLTRFDTIPAVPVVEVVDALRGLIDAVDCPAIVHSCAAPRWDLITRMPGVGWSLDVTSVTSDDLDGLGMLLDRGDVLVAGVVPGTGGDRRVRAETVATRLATLVDRIGLPRKVLSDSVVVSPTCGLAGAEPGWAKAALGVCAATGELLGTDPEAL